MNYNRFLGYTEGEDGKLEIVPEEAEVVKRIYREYLEGGSTISIAKGSSMMVLKLGTAGQNGMEPLFRRSSQTRNT